MGATSPSPRRGSLGELAQQGLEVRIWCNQPGCRHYASRPAAELAQLLGPDTSVYGCWLRLRCGCCGASGKIKGNIFAMAEWPAIPMGFSAR